MEAQRVKYKDIVAGDIGNFSDGTVWIAKDEFVPDIVHNSQQWGRIPVFIPFERDMDSRELQLAEHTEDMWIEGTTETWTTVLYRMEG